MNISRKAREFYKGANEDRDFLELTLIQGMLKLPGDWSLSRQSRFGAWAQLLGCDSKWEGGYLWIIASLTVQTQLRAVQAETQGDFDGESLPRPPKLLASQRGQVRVTVDGWSKDERRRLELALELNGPTNWPKIQQTVETKSIQECVRYYESMGPTVDARHRMRRWQQGASPLAHQVEAEDLVRRLSMVARKSSMGLGARRSSIGLMSQALRRSR